MGSFLSCTYSICTDGPDTFLHKQMFHPPLVNQNRIDKLKNIQDLILYQIPNTKSNDTIGLFRTPFSLSGKWIVFSHGNAATIFDYPNYALKLSNVFNIGCIFYDYPGYGLSTGNPTDFSCVETLDMVITHMVTDLKIQKHNIILIGQSIGTGVIMEYAHQQKWNHPMILISPYKSVITVATETSQCLTQYIDKFPSLKYIKEMKCPIKIFHGTDDTVIPITHGMDLFDAMPNKIFGAVWLDGVGHNNILESINFKHLAEVINHDN